MNSSLPPVPRGVLLHIWRQLEPQNRSRCLTALGLILITAFADTASLGSISLLASGVAAPETVLNAKPVRWVFELLGVAPTSTEQFLFWLASLVILLVGGKNILSVVVNYWNVRLGCLLDADIGIKLYKGFLAMPYWWHQEQNTATLGLIVRNRSYIGTRVCFSCLEILVNASVMGTMFLALLVVQPGPTLIALAVVGISSFALYQATRSRVVSEARRAYAMEVGLNEEVAMAMQGIKDVLLGNIGPEFLQRFVRGVHAYAACYGHIACLQRLPASVMESLGIIFIAVMVIVMLAMGKSAAYLTGVMAFMAVAAWRVLPASTRVLHQLTLLREYAPQAADILSYLDVIHTWALPELPNGGAPRSLPPLAADWNTVEFDHVTHCYRSGDAPALTDMQFILKKGACVGVVGRSGAGKSTFVDVLTGLLQPGQGQVRIDAVPLTRDNAPQWMHHIGYVAQSPYLLDASLAHNVAFTLNPDLVDMDRVAMVCRMAAMDFVEQLPDGLTTELGERGVRLSGGQRQRVAIARALYHAPSLLIFDEATSALDNASEAAIQQTIHSLQAGHTMILIAHRLTTVEHCDRILWMDGGKLRMDGPAADVLPHYRAWLATAALQDPASEAATPAGAA